jgi:hypothetical protein
MSGIANDQGAVALSANFEGWNPMNIHQTLAHIFPAGVVGGCSPDEGGLFEVHGLPSGTVPENCQVLAGGHAPHARHEHRESYLVKTEDFVLFFDVCGALPGSGDGEFVQSGGYAGVADGQSHDLLAYARKSIELQQH